MLSLFKSKKHQILGQLHKPDAEYQDLSPKGYVDEEIRGLVHRLNELPGYVTTSSCAGRVVVYLEGAGKPLANPVLKEEATTQAEGVISPTSSKGGKGGGRWLFNSHTPILLTDLSDTGTTYSKLGFERDARISFPPPDALVRFLHLKFEPLILHVLTQSAEHAQALLGIAMAAGFRESGISGVVDSKGHHATPMMAVRSAGLAIDCIVGFQLLADSDSPSTTQFQPMVPEEYLRTILQVANDRFRQNAERTERFQAGMISEFAGVMAPSDDYRSDERRRGGYQTAAAAKAQKRAEDMRKRDVALQRRAENMEIGGALDGASSFEAGQEDTDLDLNLLLQEGNVEERTLVDEAEYRR